MDHQLNGKTLRLSREERPLSAPSPPPQPERAAEECAHASYPPHARTGSGPLGPSTIEKDGEEIRSIDSSENVVMEDGGTGATLHPGPKSTGSGRDSDRPLIAVTLSQSHTAPGCSACQQRWRTSGSVSPLQPQQHPMVGCGTRGGQYSICDVARHNTPDDCWLTAHGVVYDVTRFIDEHPGGTFSILRHAGTECAEDFDFHSRGARNLWGSFQIGTLRRCQAGGGGGSAYSCVLQ